MWERFKTWAFEGSQLKAGIAGALMGLVAVAAYFGFLMAWFALLGKMAGSIILMVVGTLWGGYAIGKFTAESKASQKALDAINEARLERTRERVEALKTNTDDLDERLNKLRDTLSDY